jgi:hypothetical protein
LSDPLADLEVLSDPEPRIVAIRGEVIAVLPVRFGKMGPFSKAVDPALTAILAGKWKEALEDHSDALIRAVAIGIGRDEGWVADRFGDDFMRLCDAVLEVNQDFFAQQLMPVAIPLAVKLAALMNMVGATAQPSLSSADTELPTS